MFNVKIKDKELVYQSNIYNLAKILFLDTKLTTLVTKA